MVSQFYVCIGGLWPHFPHESFFTSINVGKYFRISNPGTPYYTGSALFIKIPYPPRELNNQKNKQIKNSIYSCNIQLGF